MCRYENRDEDGDGQGDFRPAPKRLAAEQSFGGFQKGRFAEVTAQSAEVRTAMIRLAGVTRLRFRDEPNVLNALTVPHKRSPAAKVSAAALAMTAALEPHREFLASEGIDLGRLERVKTGAKRLTALIQERDRCMLPSREATSRLPAALSIVSSEMAAARMSMLDDPVFGESAKPPKVGKRLGRKPKRRKRKRG